ncbi:MAG: hypothetical protein IH969_06575, partial [Candidatus Krumholzibacteriota bacterium]|nr:hypothetical protein [Candidatus Krumholzibacteriota bacterium]
EPTIDDLVLANMLAVQEAAEAYAIVDSGEFPAQPWYTTQDGRTLFDFLPNGEKLENPVSGQATDPVEVEPDGLGSTSYRGVIATDFQTFYNWVGYVITGRGESGDIVITNAPDSLVQRHQHVIDNCLIVQAAAESFAADNNGVYAVNGGSRSLLGKVLTHYLPDSTLLINPYTNAATEPNWGGLAAAAGAIGYLSIDITGDLIMDGYFIDAIGADGASQIKFICYNSVRSDACDN